MNKTIEELDKEINIQKKINELELLKQEQPIAHLIHTTLIILDSPIAFIIFVSGFIAGWLI